MAERGSVSSSHEETLSYLQLYYASRQIESQYINRVARQLGLTSELGEIEYHLQQHPLIVNSDYKMFRILQAWKDKEPGNCTLDNLNAALQELDFNNTAVKVTEAVQNGSQRKNATLDEDEKCKAELSISDKMITEVSRIVPGQLYYNVGLELGFKREQIDTIEASCKTAKIPNEYIYQTLKTWKEIDVMGAKLGKLYRALRMLDYNDTANQVFEKCTAIAHSERPGYVDQK